MSENNLQHTMRENVDFTVTTNPLYSPMLGSDPPQVNIPTQSQMMPLTDPMEERLHTLEKKARAMEMHDTLGLDATNMCLVPNLVIPPKFKVPNFEKYTGLSCPKRHLVMFCRKMTSYTHDDKMMIHCFQDSLSGASLSWYMDLERSRIQTWGT